MTTQPERQKIIYELAKLWDTCPDLQLGQLLFLVGASDTGVGANIFRMKDEEIYRKVARVDQQIIDHNRI